MAQYPADDGQCGVQEEMKETLEVINRMQADGVIGRYAIGGAVGATFYLEPVATLDIDVFVSFRTMADRPLISLSPLYDYLKARGHDRFLGDER